MTTILTSRMDDSYVERAGRNNGRSVLPAGHESRAGRNPDKTLDEILPPERLADLFPKLQGHDDLDLTTLAYHLQQSDATAADGYSHAAINEARSFLEALVMDIAVARQQVPFGKFRKDREDKSGFRTGCLYLRALGFIDEEEELLLQHVYGIASAKGSHHGMADVLWCRLVRQMVGITGRYLIHRYGTWVGAGCPGPAAAEEEKQTPAPTVGPLSGFWQQRLAGIWRRAMERVRGSAAGR